MRKLFGIGKPRCLQGGLSFMYSLQLARTVLRAARSTLNRREQSRSLMIAELTPLIVAICGR
jgi:hypothetical protein